MSDLRAERPNPNTREAIQKIGTNALPYVINDLNSKDSWLELKLTALLSRQSFIEPLFQPAQETREGAMRVFLILRSEAAGAIPRIREMLHDPEKSYIAANALFAIGTNSIPTLIDGCGHTNRSVRTYCAYVLSKLSGGGGYTTQYIPAGSTNAVYRFAFTMSDGDVKALIANLSHSNPNVRRASAERLGDRCRMKIATNGIPVLIQLSHEQNTAVREAALEALQKINSQHLQRQEQSD